MRLSELLADMRDVEVAGHGDPGIAGIADDSRLVEPGFLFAAIPGNKGDGAAYIGEAVNKGAAALLVSFVPRPEPPVPYVVAADVRKALGEASASFYDNPSASLQLVGVTGTNGKTTTAYLLRHILNEAGRRCGMLGTVEYDLGDRLRPSPLTTPGPVAFSAHLAEMRDFECAAAVVEVSSHALDQERVWPHRFAAAVFTNLTRDHLDYHGDMDAYAEAKHKLFARLDERAVAVFNLGDPYAARMAEGVVARRLGYALAAGDGDTRDKHDIPDIPADALRAEMVSGDLSGQTFRVKGYGMDRDIRTPLIGRHNVENCLGALLAAVGLGVSPHAVADALAGFPGVPGRLERIASPSGAVAFVDYAHTDDALRSVLSVLRPLTRGRLITVFGCGGDRDRGKRPLMAKAAEEYSDLVVVTSDNPRTEDPDEIIRQIKPGFARPEKNLVEPDRAKAIHLAVSRAGAGDVVLVAGKGHEDYQLVGAEKRHLDDREVVREAFGTGKG